MTASSIASAPAALVPDLIAAQMVGGGGDASASGATSQASDAVAISAEALAMLEAEQGAMAGMITSST